MFWFLIRRLWRRGSGDQGLRWAASTNVLFILKANTVLAAWRVKWYIRTLSYSAIAKKGSVVSTKCWLPLWFVFITFFRFVQQKYPKYLKKISQWGLLKGALCHLFLIKKFYTNAKYFYTLWSKMTHLKWRIWYTVCYIQQGLDWSNDQTKIKNNSLSLIKHPTIIIMAKTIIFTTSNLFFMQQIFIHLYNC